MSTSFIVLFFTRFASSNLITTCVSPTLSHKRSTCTSHEPGAPPASLPSSPKPIPSQKSVYLTHMITSWVYFWCASRSRYSVFPFSFFQFYEVATFAMVTRGFSQVWLQVTWGSKNILESSYSLATCRNLVSNLADFLSIRAGFLARNIQISPWIFHFARVARRQLEFCNSANFLYQRKNAVPPSRIFCADPPKKNSP